MPGKAWQGTLAVKILGATDLRPCDKNGKSDPFVRLQVHPSYAVVNNEKDRVTKKLKTSVKKKTLEPVWHETLGPFDIDGARSLEFIVLDWNLMAKPDLCGSASVRLDDLGLRCGLAVRAELPLRDQGTLVVEVEYDDNQDLFGLDLTSVVAREGGDVPNIMRRCTEAVERMGVREPGLYRVPGSQTDVNNLKAMFIEDGFSEIPGEIADVNTVASLLKLYLREMPEPLFTNALHNEVVAAARRATKEDYGEFVAVLKRLPKPHFDAVAHLFGHLRKVLAESEANKMTADNLATCFGPSVVSRSDDESGQDALVVSVGQDNVVVSKLLQLPRVLDEAVAASGGDGGERVPARRERKTRSSLAYKPVECEWGKVVGDMTTPVRTFAAFRDLCYELGCRATPEDYADAGGAEGVDLGYDTVVAWVRRSRLAQFVHRSAHKRQGIVQAISYFQYFDKNRDGNVDATEWPALHADLRSHYPWLSEDPRECLAQLDANKNGNVELEEYLEWCLKGSPADGAGAESAESAAPAPQAAPRVRASEPVVSQHPRSPKSSPKPPPRSESLPSGPAGSPKPRPRAAHGHGAGSSSAAAPGVGGGSPKPKPRHGSPKGSPKPSPRARKQIAMSATATVAGAE